MVCNLIRDIIKNAEEISNFAWEICSSRLIYILVSFQVAGGHVDMAVGADQGGSIRNPAGRCGIVGLKPTLGLVPYTGIVPMEFSLDHVGLMAKTVHDVALLLEVGILGNSW